MDLIDRQAAIDAVYDHLKAVGGGNEVYHMAHRHIAEVLALLPTAQPEILACGEGELNAQPETARRIAGKSRDGMTMWYQCDMCNEPVDIQDAYCSGCGRRLTDANN